MSAPNYYASLKLLLVSEGGYVNNPHDPGGATNQGVTQRNYDLYRRSHKMALRSVKLITAGEVFDIYRMLYWNAVKADLLPIGIDYAVFDYCVNSGEDHAAKDIQRSVNSLGVKKPLNVDGQLGAFTLHAIHDAPQTELLHDYVARRLAFQKTLPTWGDFGKGWENRDNAVLAQAGKMIAQ